MQRMPLSIASLILLLSMHRAIAQATTAVPAVASKGSSIPALPSDLTAGFTGKWVGQREYRDFGDGSRVFLPTWLTVKATENHLVAFQYTYDDGPTKTVRERLTLSLDIAGASATLASEGDHSETRYAVEGYPAFAKLGRGILKLTGTGIENNKKVDVRITLTLRRNLYVLLKETRLPGEDFKFRDQYTMTRAEEPK